MGFMHTFIMSIIASIVIDKVSNLNVYKYIADCGYKLNFQKIKEMEESRKKPGVITINLNKIFRFIPGANIAFSLFMFNFTNNKRDFLFEQYDISGILEEMTDEEKKKYLAHPNGFNAWYISSKKSSSVNNDDVTMNCNVKDELKEDVISLEPVIQEVEVKPLTRLERYKQLRDMIKTNGWLYGEDLWEYKELQEEFEEDSSRILK